MSQYHKIQGLYKRDMNKNSPNYDKIKRINKKKRFLKLWKTEYNETLEIK